jgi:hypothetical protein
MRQPLLCGIRHDIAAGEERETRLGRLFGTTVPSNLVRPMRHAASAALNRIGPMKPVSTLEFRGREKCVLPPLPFLP